MLMQQVDLKSYFNLYICPVHKRFLEIIFQYFNRFWYYQNITQPKHFVILFKKYDLEVDLFKKD